MAFLATLAGADSAKAQTHGFGITITKECPLSVMPGEEVTCTIAMENDDGDHSVIIESLTDQLADGPITNVTGCASELAADDGVHESGPDFTSCTDTFTIPADLELCGGQIQNQVEVSFHDAEFTTLADTNQASGIMFVQCPNITVQKTAGAASIEAGQTASFTITVTNEGPGPASGVTLSDTLPGTGWTENPDNADCTITAGANDSLQCSFGDLAEGATETVTVQRTTSTADCGTLSNTATVAATNEDPDQSADNTSTANMEVTCPQPNVTVLKTAAASPINSGDMASFTITVTNAGPGGATGVSLSDTLPGTGWTENPDNPDCTITAGANDSLQCNFGDLAEGATETVTVQRTTSTADCGTLSNTATVSATNEDPTKTGDNSSTATITVNCPTPGNEGCTPGYWKQEFHFDSWVGYSPDQTLESVFDVPDSLSMDNVTLLDALQGGGGPGVQGAAKILFRAAVAALLNASSTDVDYTMTTTEIIDAVNAALASNNRQTMLNLAGELDRDNNLGCPLN